jgi:HicB family
MARKRDDTVKLVLRLPPKLHRRLTRMATRDNQSLNTLMVSVLEAWAGTQDSQSLRAQKEAFEMMKRRGIVSSEWERPFAEVIEKLDKLIALAEREESEDK